MTLPWSSTRHSSSTSVRTRYTDEDTFNTWYSSTEVVDHGHTSIKGMLLFERASGPQNLHVLIVAFAPGVFRVDFSCGGIARHRTTMARCPPRHTPVFSAPHQTRSLPAVVASETWCWNMCRANTLINEAKHANVRLTERYGCTQHENGWTFSADIFFQTLHEAEVSAPPLCLVAAALQQGCEPNTTQNAKTTPTLVPCINSSW